MPSGTFLMVGRPYGQGHPARAGLAAHKRSTGFGREGDGASCVRPRRGRVAVTGSAARHRNDDGVQHVGSAAARWHPGTGRSGRVHQQ